jgi:hypothetical protein
MEERRKQLKRDMDSYLTQRRKSDGWGFFTKKPEHQLHPTIHTYKKEEPAMPDTAPEAKSKKGWFSSAVDKMFGAEDVAEDAPLEQVQSQVADASADLKELARISLGVMKRMPGDMISEFKQTPDYDAFKDILRRHKLIK